MSSACWRFGAGVSVPGNPTGVQLLKLTGWRPTIPAWSSSRDILSLGDQFQHPAVAEHGRQEPATDASLWLSRIVHYVSPAAPNVKCRCRAYCRSAASRALCGIRGSPPIRRSARGPCSCLVRLDRTPVAQPRLTQANPNHGGGALRPSHA